MISIGITGQSGFLGTHLFNTLKMCRTEFNCVDFNRDWFNDAQAMDRFVQQCDVVVHLAGVNRHPDPSTILSINIDLARNLIRSMERTSSSPHVIFSSSIQEANENPYGDAKRQVRQMFERWASKNGSKFTGLLIPNVFGPFGKPHYNSVIATFCHQLIHGDQPNVVSNAELNLVYVGEVVDLIIDQIKMDSIRTSILMKPRYLVSVQEVLDILTVFRDSYCKYGSIPNLGSQFECNLFNTFRSFEDVVTKYPVKYVQHKDDRGSFTELIRLSTGGQVSFSTTNPGFTRGNHFHTRKVERFSVIAGEALVKLRRVGTTDIIDLYLSGSEPSYVDIPIWYAHNITNVGSDELVTVFWINELYDPDDPDTHFQPV